MSTPHMSCWKAPNSSLPIRASESPPPPAGAPPRRLLLELDPEPGGGPGGPWKKGNMEPARGGEGASGGQRG
jgi:hypothetical protein